MLVRTGPAAAPGLRPGGSAPPRRPRAASLLAACTPTEVRIPGEEGEEVLLIRKRLLRAQVGPLLFWYGMNWCSMLDRPRAGCQVARWQHEAESPPGRPPRLGRLPMAKHSRQTPWTCTIRTPTHPHTHTHTHHHHHARHAPRQPGNANGATLVGPFDAARSPACRLEVVEETSKPAGWPASKTASARRSRRRGNANVGNDRCCRRCHCTYLPRTPRTAPTVSYLPPTH